MARFRHLERDELPEAYARLLGDRPLLNIFKVLANTPGIAAGVMGLNAAMRENSELDPKLKELVILRVGALSRAAYEMRQHRRIAENLGLSQEEIAAAVREGPAEVLGGLERRVLEFVDAVVLEVKAPPPLYDAVAAELNDRQVIEIILLTGYYAMMCRFLENTEVEMEPGS